MNDASKSLLSPRKAVRSFLAMLCFAIVLASNTAGAAAPNGKVLLAQALADASKETSMTISGTLTGSGLTLSIDGGYTSKASGGITTQKGQGSADEVQPNGANYGFVKANSIASLGNQLGIKHPKLSEIDVWYKVTSKDPRFANIFGGGGADTVAQTFSFSPVGWSRSATYLGTTVLRGVRVLKLSAAANLFVEKSGFGKETLYITDTNHPMPFATTGPIGTSGLIYFSKWDSTTISIPTAKTELPH